MRNKAGCFVAEDTMKRLESIGKRVGEMLREEGVESVIFTIGVPNPDAVDDVHKTLVFNCFRANREFAKATINALIELLNDPEVGMT